MPPAWTPLARPVKLSRDSGTYYRDLNAARFPKHPMEPTVRAVFEMNPRFDTSSVDVFACGSTMGNLLRYVRSMEKPFRFLVEVIGETVFFVRRENSPSAIIEDVAGFGHTFPETYTTWNPIVKGSESHQRVVRYKFGGLNILVRFESDGYLKASATSEPDERDRAHGFEDEELVSAFTAANITAPTKTQRNDALEILPGGEHIPGPSLFDIKTRAAWKKLEGDSTLDEQLPRLWTRQISKFILGYHNQGVFHDIEVQDIGDDIKTWERDNKTVLGQLGDLLQKIVATARGTSNGKLEIRCEDGVLELREQCEDACETLSEELMTRWLSSNEGNGQCAGSEAQEKQILDDDEHLSEQDEDHEQDWHSESEKDFTACSAEDCGYCGHCSY